MTKIERQALQLARGMGLTIQSCRNVRGHHHLILLAPDGTTRKVTFASSPQCREDSLQRLAKDLKTLAATLPSPTA